MDPSSIYPVTIGERTIELPIVKLSNAPVRIALADTLGDWPLCDFLAEALLAKARQTQVPLEDIQVILSAGKATTLAGSLARKMGISEYAIAEKRAKSFWSDPFGVPAKSITSQQNEQLIIGGRRAAMLKGQKILVVDDVISTGDSIHALIEIAEHYGQVAAVMAPFVEGDQSNVVSRIEGFPAATLTYLPVWPDA